MPSAANEHDPAAGDRWEYRVHHLYPPGSGSHEASLGQLNALGSMGWEVVVTIAAEKDGRAALLLKRPAG